MDGAGCLLAAQGVEEEIQKRLVGMDALRQEEIDGAMIELDGTADKRRLGANAIAAVSVAVARAAAAAHGLPFYRYLNPAARRLPVILFPMIAGGHYAGGLSSQVQEFNIIPLDAESFAESLLLAREVYGVLAGQVEKRFGPLARCTNAVGGFSLPLPGCRETLDFLLQALRAARLEHRFAIGLDCAASGWYDGERGLYRFEGEALDREALLQYYKKLVADYPIQSLEDPFDEEDMEGFARATAELGIQIVGDDLFVTTPARLREGIEKGAGNALLWKYNQVGTLTEAFAAARLARAHRYAVIPSERSGESEDAALADLCVALGAGQMKGACVRSEHTAKINRLLQIEAELGGMAQYEGFAGQRGSASVP